MNKTQPMIYGASGYTGRLIAREAVRRGLRPILAGRSLESFAALAKELDCPTRVFSLDRPEEIAGALGDVAAVAHCAGPFSATARPMMDACIASQTHYLDITGEIDVIEAGHELHERAAAAGIALMPAVGFDVVPSDCLAATLAAELPNATLLQLAFTGTGGFSPGTAKTMVEGLPHGGKARINGKLERVPPAWKTREIPFRTGTQTGVTIPWGDVASAYYSTGIPNIEVYLSDPGFKPKHMHRLRWLMPLLGIGLVQRFLKRFIEKRVPGPSDRARENSRSSLWGRVEDAQGKAVEATLETLGGYPLTVLTTVTVLEKVLAGEGPRGYATPAMAFGKDFILTMPATDLRIERAAQATAHP
ncbi:MAG: saccharopine dehydrogenase NADP-binding domain-containing protein [Pirellulales bacterium]|nr:saccharopine dehydrogenase NADP-binding domain-containing protein [Pirellulales bacterium]